MEDPDRPGDHACPHTLVTSIPDGIHKHKHTHNVNRWIEAKEALINAVPSEDVPGGMSCGDWIWWPDRTSGARSRCHRSPTGYAAAGT